MQERMTRAARAPILTLLAIVLMVGAPAVAVAKTDAGAAGDTNAVAPASAQMALSGWLGRCYPQFPNSWTAGGWCDGNGPDWTYRGVVHCTNGASYFGVMRWAGDRRKSFGLCQYSSGVWGGLYYYYKGYYRGSVIYAM
jgi:hypothetical protein